MFSAGAAGVGGGVSTVPADSNVALRWFALLQAEIRQVVAAADGPSGSAALPAVPGTDSAAEDGIDLAPELPASAAVAGSKSRQVRASRGSGAGAAP